MRTFLAWLAILAAVIAGCDQSPPLSQSVPAQSAPTSSRSGTGQGEGVIVAFGDSLTAGLGVTPQEAYPAQLEKLLHAKGYPYRVVNAGVSGDTTAGGLRRLDWVIKSRPDIVIIELGANDGLRGITLGEIRTNLSQMIGRIQAAGIHVILAGMKIPPNYGPQYILGFSNIFSELAREYKIPLIPFFLEGVAARADLNQDDGLHPTREGYQHVVDNVLPVLLPLLSPHPISNP